MSKGMMMGLAAVVGLVALGIAVFLWCMSVKNTEIALNNRYEAQKNVVETTLDAMRKTIMNQHNCTKEWADKFIKVVAQQSEGRTGGSLLKATAESSALGLPQDLYLKLSNSIEGQLASFKRSQDVLTDVWREHTTFCQNVYHSWLVGGKIKPKPEMITSDITKEAILTHKLNDNLL